MHILVIGGTGFLGYQLVREMALRGHTSRIAALPPMPAGMHFPEGTEVRFADFLDPHACDWASLLDGCDAFIFAAGADDRALPSKPASEFFRRMNVDPLLAVIHEARAAGITRGMVTGSYFTCFNRIRPELNLAARHPYILSRLQQQEEASEACGGLLRLSFLELPFIFGSTPGRLPLWMPLLRYLNSGWPVFYPKGGTAIVSVETVARFASEVLENENLSVCFPVAEDNLSWKELFAKLSAGSKNNRRFYRLPSALLKAALAANGLIHSFRGRESGLNMSCLGELLTAGLWLDVSDTLMIAKPREDALEQAFADTLDACRVGL